MQTASARIAAFLRYKLAQLVSFYREETYRGRLARRTTGAVKENCAYREENFYRPARDTRTIPVRVIT